MRKLALLLLLASCIPAGAGVPCSLPFPNIQNGQPADATQVMANYNALVSCLGNAAAAGVNSDITALTGLTTPLSQSFFGSAPSTGTNTQVVAATTPSGFILAPGATVVFMAGSSNTGPTTLQVAGAVVTNVYRRTTDGAIPLSGGEIIAGTLTTATYDGNQFQLLNGVSSVPIGTILTTFLFVADPGFLLLNGQCVSTATFVGLWNKFGHPGPGPCGANQFQLPNGSGRFFVQTGGGFSLGGVGGAMSATVAQSNLPNITLGYGVEAGGTTTQNVQITAVPSQSAQGAGGAAPPVTIQGAAVPGAIGPSQDQAGQTSSLNGNQAQQALPTLPPFLTVNQQIKF